MNEAHSKRKRVQAPAPERMEQVGVRISPETLAALEAIAAQEKRKVGQLCRIVLEEYIEKRTPV